MEGRDIEIGEDERGCRTRLHSGLVELGIGNGKQGYEGHGIQPVVELPCGQKILSRRVDEIEEKGLPVFRIEAMKSVVEG